MDRLAAIEIFIRVVDSGSFSAAARHHDIGQPTVSKAIAQLEEWLGTKLLLRTTRTVTQTEAGKCFYERAQRMVEDADEALVAVRGVASGLSGKLRVSAALCFARLHIVPRLDEFLDQHPGLDLELILDDRVINLVDEGIDIALRANAMPDSNMTIRKIAETRRRVIGTPEYFKRYGYPTAPTDLLKHRAIIHTHEGDGESWTFRKETSEVEVKIHGRVKISAADGIRVAVSSGLGLAIVSEWAFAPELRSGEVITVLDDWLLPTVNLSAVYPTGRLASTKARHFAAFVESCFAG